MNRSNRVVKLLKNRLYPTYQLHAYMASDRLSAQEGLRLAALTAFGSWMPGVRVSPLGPNKNADFDTIGVLIFCIERCVEKMCHFGNQRGTFVVSY